MKLCERTFKENACNNLSFNPDPLYPSSNVITYLHRASAVLDGLWPSHIREFLRLFRYLVRLILCVVSPLKILCLYRTAQHNRRRQQCLEGDSKQQSLFPRDQGPRPRLYGHCNLPNAGVRLIISMGTRWVDLRACIGEADQY